MPIILIVVLLAVAAYLAYLYFMPADDGPNTLMDYGLSQSGGQATYTVGGVEYYTSTATRPPPSDPDYYLQWDQSTGCIAQTTLEGELYWVCPSDNEYHGLFTVWYNTYGWQYE